MNLIVLAMQQNLSFCLHLGPAWEVTLVEGIRWLSHCPVKIQNDGKRQCDM